MSSLLFSFIFSFFLLLFTFTILLLFLMLVWCCVCVPSPLISSLLISLLISLSLSLSQGVGYNRVLSSAINMEARSADAIHLVSQPLPSVVIVGALTVGPVAPKVSCD
jgi:hypothetical protein